MDNEKYMDIEAFLNPSQMGETRVVISEKYKDKSGKPVEWVLKAVPVPVANEIRKKNTKFDGGRRVYVDTEKVNAELAVASLIYPDLKDARIQEAYGTYGEIDTLYAMLNDGECSKLIQEALKVNGYGKSLEETVKEIKNS